MTKQDDTTEKKSTPDLSALYKRLKAEDPVNAVENGDNRGEAVNFQLPVGLWGGAFGMIQGNGSGPPL